MLFKKSVKNGVFKKNKFQKLKTTFIKNLNLSKIIFLFKKKLSLNNYE